MNVGVDNAAVAVTVVDGSKVVVVGENAVAACLLRTVATAMAMGDDHTISFGVILVDDRRGRSRHHLAGRKLSFRTANCIHDDCRSLLLMLIRRAEGGCHHLQLLLCFRSNDD